VSRRTLPFLVLVLAGCEPRGGTILIPESTPPSGDDDDDVDDDDADDDDAFQNTDSLVINELMSANDSAIFDDGGLATDWIELYNGTEETIELGGWTLTDDWRSPDLSTLPAGLAVESGGHLLLWAGGDASRGPRHLDFSLERAGEAIGIFDAEGREVQWLPFPALPRDHSWSRVRDGWEDWEQVFGGTPGRAN